MKKIYYLAYGSNLNERQMKFRCPNAVKVGSAILDDYELEFRLYLTVNPKKGSKVPIGVWEVTPSDEKRLDAYEGYPTFYRKEYLTIEIDGKEEQALIYIMNDVRKVAPPTRTYLETCGEGYRDFGFDFNYLKEAYYRSINK